MSSFVSKTIKSQTELNLSFCLIKSNLTKYKCVLFCGEDKRKWNDKKRCEFYTNKWMFSFKGNSQKKRREISVSVVLVLIVFYIKKQK